MRNRNNSKKALVLKKNREHDAGNRFHDLTNAISVLAMYRVLTREFTEKVGRYHGSALRGRGEDTNLDFPFVALSKAAGRNDHKKAKVHAVASRKKAPKKSRKAGR
ncbi:MAG: hypothetical protein K2Y01_09210 [Rhabdochlamydiaceae bacterium]|nr:hypothetical protein [Rhabdochlamydiaceae bacterium]